MPTAAKLMMVVMASCSHSAESAITRRNGAHHDERGGRHMAARRHAAQVLAAENHLIAGIGENQSAGGGLQAQQAGDEGHQHDHDDGAKADLAHGGAQQGDDRVLVGARHHGAHVRDRQDEGQAHPGGGGAADVDGHAHGLGDHAAGVRRLLGDVAAGLEAVVAEHGGERGGEECRPVAAVRMHEGGIDQHFERLVPRKQQQITADHDGAHQFADEAEHRHARQQARAAQIQQRGHGDEHQGDERGRDGRAVDAEQLREKRRDAGRHPRHGAAQAPRHTPIRPSRPSACPSGAAPRDTGRRRSGIARRFRRTPGTP